MHRNQLLLLTLLVLFNGNAQAHKMRSVLLMVTEHSAAVDTNTDTVNHQVTLDLKSSLDNTGRPASITTHFEPTCTPLGKAITERLDDAVLRHYSMDCKGGLAGRQLRLNGLNPTTPDAFVEIRFANGNRSHHSLGRHSEPIQLTPATASSSAALGAYFSIGVEHILLGIDHLLFVLGLLLLLQQTTAGWKVLVGTITAFTVAHSITLGLAVLAGITLPTAAVEIVIALSILLLASEIYRHPQRQQQGLPATLTANRPWLVAFGFGLLHGFGFAGALSDIGVPEQAAVWALLLFNLGVEIGQLVFVALVLLLLFSVSKLPNHRRLLRWNQHSMTYCIGGLAMFWILERSVPLLAN
jgi:hypothetical protein